MARVIRFPVERCRRPRPDRAKLHAQFDAEMERLRQYLIAAGGAWTEADRKDGGERNG